MEEDALAAELKKEPGHIPDVNTDYLISGRLEAWTRILLRDRATAGFICDPQHGSAGAVARQCPHGRKNFRF